MQIAALEQDPSPGRTAERAGVDPRAGLRARPVLAAALLVAAGQCLALGLPGPGPWPAFALLAAGLGGAAGAALALGRGGRGRGWVAAAALLLASLARTGWDARPDAIGPGTHGPGTHGPGIHGPVIQGPVIHWPVIQGPGTREARPDETRTDETAGPESGTPTAGDHELGPRRGRASRTHAPAIGAPARGSSGSGPTPPAALPTGRVERLPSGRARLVGPSAGPWELEFLGPAPRAGERVALLPPGEFRPRVVGPVAGPAGAPPGVRRVSPDELVRLEAAPGGPLARLGDVLVAYRDAARARIVRRAETCGATGTTGLAPALLVGSREALDPTVADLFTRTGTRHLLALSGLHVGLLAILLLDPLARLVGAAARRAGLGPRAARRLDLCGRVLGVAAFALLAGGSPPVVRAALALAAGALAGHVPPAIGGDGLTEGRRPDGLSIWGAALTLECLAEPRAVDDLGVALSYAATLGILLLAAPLTRRLERSGGVERRRRQVLRWHRSLPRIAAGIVAERLARGLRASLACSLAAVLATLPIAWSRFGEVAPVGVLATVAAAPAIAALLVLHWIGVAFAATPWIEAAHAVEHLLVRLLEVFDRWPGTPLQLPPRPTPVVAGAAVLCATALAFAPARRAVLACAALVALGLRPPSRPEHLTVELLDVGHGTCVVVELPDAPPVVFDAGARDRPGIVAGGLAPLVRARGWSSVVVVASHADRDHWSGLPWLSSRVAVAAWLGVRPVGADRGARPAPRFDAPAPPPGGASRAALELPGGACLTLLRGANGDGNEGSRSLRIDWRGRRLLLCGDAVDAGLAASLRAGDLEGPFDLVLLPHHGGHGEAVDALLDALRAERLWVSAEGRPAVASELERRGLDWRCTSVEGPLALDLPPAAPIEAPGRNPRRRGP